MPDCPDAVILPNDEQLLSIALGSALSLGLVLQTDGKRCVMAPRLLPRFARITGGGSAHTPAPEPEAA